MSIVHPRWATGGHGDLAAAYVLALWQCYGDEVPQPPQPFEVTAKQRRAEHFAEEMIGTPDRRGGKHPRRRMR